MKTGIYFLTLSFVLFSCATLKKKGIQVRENAPRFDQTLTVLHISIDGYRHDYNKLYKPPTLMKLARQGVRTRSLISSFPSNTFPNHLSLATGCYPGRHGIINNHFYAPKLKKNYTLKDRNSLKDPQFYQCDPLWVLASKNQMVSATFFWPGSEAPISGHLPSYYLTYKHSTPHQKRINQVVKWLKLPLRKRPHYVTIYFSDVDSAGHVYGPHSKEVREAVAKVDSSIKMLLERVEKLDLDLSIIVTSDHGMTQAEKPIQFGHKKLLQSFSAINGGSLSFLYYRGEPSQKQKTIDGVVEQLSTDTSFYQVYRRKELPPRFHGNNNPRFGDVILLARPPHTLKPPSSLGSVRSFKGKHGYDPQHPDMQGIFFTKGPGFKKQMTFPSIENIHIYPLIARLLGLTYSPDSIDGRAEKITSFLSNP